MLTLQRFSFDEYWGNYWHMGLINISPRVTGAVAMPIRAFYGTVTVMGKRLTPGGRFVRPVTIKQKTKHCWPTWTYRIGLNWTLQETDNREKYQSCRESIVNSLDSTHKAVSDWGEANLDRFNATITVALNYKIWGALKKRYTVTIAMDNCKHEVSHTVQGEALLHTGTIASTVPSSPVVYEILLSLMGWYG